MLSDHPDRLLEKAFAFFDAHPDVPYLVVAASDFTIEKGDHIPTPPVLVDYNRCVGCGLCEEGCSHVVFSEPALLTFSHGRGQPTALAELPTDQVPKLW